MKKVKNKIDFDLSILNLEELINLYASIEDFRKLLESKKIIFEEAVSK